MKNDKVIGWCRGCGDMDNCNNKKITKDMLGIYNDDVKKEIKTKRKDIVGKCYRGYNIFLEEITDQDIRLILEI